MKIILLEDVKNVGKKGDIIEKSDGYVRNYILPHKLGVEATPKNLNDLKLQKANEEKIAAEQLQAAKDFAKEMEEQIVVVKMKSGEGGKAFGSVSSKEIAAAYKLQSSKRVRKSAICRQKSKLKRGSCLTVWMRSRRLSVR